MSGRASRIYFWDIRLESAGVNLEKAKQTCLQFPLIPGVMGSDRDMLFQESSRFGAAYALEGQLFCPASLKKKDGFW
jgi:hypothetical protein